MRGIPNDRARAIRLKKGLTTTELGNLANTSHTTITRFEMGDVVKASTLLNVANALKVGVEEIRPRTGVTVAESRAELEALGIEPRCGGPDELMRQYRALSPEERAIWREQLAEIARGEVAA